MKIGTILGVSLAAALAGCATVHSSYGPDGQRAYTLNCSGAARGWDKCFQAAGKICRDAGYTVIDRSSEGMTAIGGGSSGFFGGHSNERAMVIECKHPS